MAGRVPHLRRGGGSGEHLYGAGGLDEEQAHLSLPAHDASGSAEKRTSALYGEFEPMPVQVDDLGALAASEPLGAMWRIDPETNDVTRINIPHLTTASPWAPTGNSG